MSAAKGVRAARDLLALGRTGMTNEEHWTEYGAAMVLDAVARWLEEPGEDPLRLAALTLVAAHGKESAAHLTIDWDSALGRAVEEILLEFGVTPVGKGSS